MLKYFQTPVIDENGNHVMPKFLLMRKLVSDQGWKGHQNQTISA